MSSTSFWVGVYHVGDTQYVPDTLPASLRLRPSPLRRGPPVSVNSVVASVRPAASLPAHTSSSPLRSPGRTRRRWSPSRHQAGWRRTIQMCKQVDVDGAAGVQRGEKDARKDTAKKGKQQCRTCWAPRAWSRHPLGPNLRRLTKKCTMDY